MPAQLGQLAHFNFPSQIPPRRPTGTEELIAGTIGKVIENYMRPDYTGALEDRGIEDPRGMFQKLLGVRPNDATTIGLLGQQTGKQDVDQRGDFNNSIVEDLEGKRVLASANQTFNQRQTGVENDFRDDAQRFLEEIGRGDFELRQDAGAQSAQRVINEGTDLRSVVEDRTKSQELAVSAAEQKRINDIRTYAAALKGLEVQERGQDLTAEGNAANTAVQQGYLDRLITNDPAEQLRAERELNANIVHQGRALGQGDRAADRADDRDVRSDLVSDRGYNRDVTVGDREYLAGRSDQSFNRGAMTRQLDQGDRRLDTAERDSEVTRLLQGAQTKGYDLQNEGSRMLQDQTRLQGFMNEVPSVVPEQARQLIPVFYRRFAAANGRNPDSYQELMAWRQATEQAVPIDPEEIARELATEQARQQFFSEVGAGFMDPMGLRPVFRELGLNAGDQNDPGAQAINYDMLKQLFGGK